MTPTVRRKPQSPRRVLCVDDNAFTLFVITMVLRNQGYQVFACADSLRAASIARSEELDFAILDYEMPNMNGAELAAFCKAVNPDIKVILFSGSLHIPNRDLAFVDLFVRKSGGVEELLQAIETVLVKKNKLQSPEFENLQEA